MGGAEVNRLPDGVQRAMVLVRMRGHTLDSAAEVPSPCISICRMNAATGLCEGCFRTVGEIAAWSGADEDGKRRIWRSIDRRMALLEAGGPSGQTLSA